MDIILNAIGIVAAVGWFYLIIQFNRKKFVYNRLGINILMILIILLVLESVINVFLGK